MAVNQEGNIDILIKKFRSMALTKSDTSRRNYDKAIRCLETFMGTYPYASDFPSEQTLADWLLNMRVRGISGKTVIHYIDIISALYKDVISESTPNNPRLFSEFKARAKQILTSTTKEWPIDDKILKRILSITKSSSAFSEKMLVASDIFTFSLLNGAMSLLDVAKVKTDEIDDSSDAISVIIKRNSELNRKYLFPLNQSKLTTKQLAENAELKVRGLFVANHITEVESIDDTIKLIWTYAALRCGIPGSEIIAILGAPVRSIPESTICVKSDISIERRSALMETVNTLFCNNPLRWYAMKLRSHVVFEDVENRVKNLDDHILRPEFFYPYDEIRKRVGKKIVKEQQPVIPDIVFFKLRVTDIFSLFNRIGDLAWCYTITGKPGGDYAPIPKRSFERFQETIGHFTPEYEIAAIGGFEPKEGESVVIISGPLANYEFEVDKHVNTDNVIFQLNMIGDNGFQWRTSAKKRQIEPSTSH
ncbi:MAG: hypothetical protein NC453_20165 [Muribaculum sp.]|nr:hypothetical protein [Muribaculum sp.]